MPFINLITTKDDLASRVRAAFPEKEFQIEVVPSFAIAKKKLFLTDVLIVGSPEEEHYKILKTLWDEITSARLCTIDIKDKLPEWEGFEPGYHIDFNMNLVRTFKKEELRSLVERMLASVAGIDDNGESTL